MRKFLYLFLLLFGTALTAQAQTTPQTPPQEKPSAKEAPAKEASKADQPETVEDIERSIDLDRFFKKGEENAKNGASCNKPSTPADPVA